MPVASSTVVSMSHFPTVSCRRKKDDEQVALDRAEKAAERQRKAEEKEAAKEAQKSAKEADKLERTRLRCTNFCCGILTSILQFKLEALV